MPASGAAASPAGCAARNGSAAAGTGTPLPPAGGRRRAPPSGPRRFPQAAARRRAGPPARRLAPGRGGCWPRGWPGPVGPEGGRRERGREGSAILCPPPPARPCTQPLAGSLCRRRRFSPRRSLRAEGRGSASRSRLPAGKRCPATATERRPSARPAPPRGSLRACPGPAARSGPVGNFRGDRRRSQPVNSVVVEVVAVQVGQNPAYVPQEQGWAGAHELITAMCLLALQCGEECAEP